nr:immunoglobulin heavy chain junction region [Mus musculus]MBK4183862.1 immunoglobulin heavy chain junction region [Mus musculus]MBK4185484.1 immunoglobulin heavy chain junction region [Mus musculus]MBK4186578.1 immunoglobulin heavy chain junction region [Mus musculus]MBK4190020.1 immunoglobulin heavy chain junction region [Mus musculus]
CARDDLGGNWFAYW